MIVVSEDGTATQTARIGAEPASIETEVFNRQLAIDEMEAAAREFIAARQGDPGTRLDDSMARLTAASVAATWVMR